MSDKPGIDGKEFKVQFDETWFNVPKESLELIFGGQTLKDFKKSLEEECIRTNPWIKEEKERLEKKLEKKPVYDISFNLPKKEFDEFLDSITMNAINKDALDKEWEEKKNNLDKYTNDYFKE